MFYAQVTKTCQTTVEMFYLGPFPGTIHRESASRLTFQVRHVWIRFQDPVSRVTAQLLPFPKERCIPKHTNIRQCSMAQLRAGIAPELR